MTTIARHQDVITQINVFEVEPDKVDLLVATLKEAARAVTRVPGWMSINNHVSLDRTKVTNYAQCTSKEAWDAVMDVLYKEGYIDTLNALARPHPCLYDVVWTLNHNQVSRGR